MVGMLCEGGRRGVCGGVVVVVFWIFFIAGAGGVEENNRRRREERDGRPVVVQVRESLRNRVRAVLPDAFRSSFGHVGADAAKFSVKKFRWIETLMKDKGAFENVASPSR